MMVLREVQQPRKCRHFLRREVAPFRQKRSATYAPVRGFGKMCGPHQDFNGSIALQIEAYRSAEAASRSEVRVSPRSARRGGAKSR